MSSSPFVDAPPNDWDIPDDIGLKKKKKTPKEKAEAREERAKAEKAKKQAAGVTSRTLSPLMPAISTAPRSDMGSKGLSS